MVWTCVARPEVLREGLNRLRALASLSLTAPE